MKKTVLLLSMITLLSGCKINEAIRSVNSAVNQIVPSMESPVTEATYAGICKDFSDNEIAAKKNGEGSGLF